MGLSYSIIGYFGMGSSQTFFFFFDRKRQRNILIEKRSTREEWGILPLKKTKLQEYENKKIQCNNEQTL